MVGQLLLLFGRFALLAGFPGLQNLFVFHPVGIVLEEINFGLDFLLLGFQQAGFEFGEAGHDGQGLVLADLLQERGHPGLGLGGTVAVEVVSHRPEMLLGVKEIQALASLREAVLGQIPNPQSSVGDDQDQLRLAQTAVQCFPIELGAQGLEALSAQLYREALDRGLGKSN